MDVKTAFLHGDLDKKIYMEQLEGFIVKGKEDYVCKCLIIFVYIKVRSKAT